MTVKRYIPLFLSAVALLFTSSCGSLDVDPHLPGPGDVLQTPEDLLDASAQLYQEWFNTAHATAGPALALATAADQLTTVSGTAAAKDMALEPRQPFNNDPGYAYMHVTEDFWANSYRIVLLANDILRAIEDKPTILYEGKDIKPMLTAWAYFIRGVGYGYLGLLFDKANLVDVHTPLPVEKFTDYHGVVTFALSSLDSAIAISGKHAFELPEDFIRGVTLDAQRLRRLSASYAARLLVCSPRNDFDMQYVPWQRVWDYAAAGITEDVMPVTDDEHWKDEARKFAISPVWGGVDLRILHILDNNYPARWPADNSSWETPDGQRPDSTFLQSPDARAVTDLAWSPPKQIGTPYYLNTLYRLSRYDDWAVDASGPVPVFTVAENELLGAEALVHVGRTEEAVTLLNNGTRTSRGHLPPLASGASEKEVLNAIFYERDIELILAGTGLSFFDMRRRNMLQTGTPLHFPVPGKELQLMGLEIYTFGGVENADGINTSNGGWGGEKE